MTETPVGGGLRRLMEKKCTLPVRLILLALSVVIFAFFARNARYAAIDDAVSFNFEPLYNLAMVSFTVVFLILMLFQFREGGNVSVMTWLLLTVITGCVVLGKISLLDYVSDDYEIFLSGWLEEYEALTLKQGLGTYIGSDYSPPYLYILLLISRLKNYPWMYMIKAVSMAAEGLMAYSVMKLSSLKLRSGHYRLLAFHMTLLLPTLVFNGAYWGQCDVIYSGFCLLALFHALKGRGALSMGLVGVALSFKFQTVFILPVLLPLWLRRDVKLWNLLMIPAAYMVMMIPALWGGKSLHHVLTVYLQQAANYNFLTMNGPSLYEIFPRIKGMENVIYNMFSNMAMMMALAYMAGVCVLLILYRDALTDEAVILSALVLTGGIPYLLPKMHERYTFMADLLALTVCLFNRRRAALPLLFGMASYVCYTGALNGKEIMELKWSALFMGAGVVLAAFSLVDTLRSSKNAALAEVKA